MELTKDDIVVINRNAPSDQGVFIEPYGIPTDIKEHVVYMRYVTGGVEGGSYHSDSVLRSFTNSERPEFKALDLVLEKLMPAITYLQYRQVTELIQTNHQTEREYYGNSDEWEIRFIVLSELIEKLKTFKK
jgi:hypothetical protein